MSGRSGSANVRRQVGLRLRPGPIRPGGDRTAQDRVRRRLTAWRQRDRDRRSSRRSPSAGPPHHKTRSGGWVCRIGGDSTDVAATASDVFHPDAFVDSTHVTPAERAALARLLEAGLVDVDVARWGPRARRFTWWNHGVGYTSNLGMRIDLIATDRALAGRLDTTWIDHLGRAEQRPSDTRPSSPISIRRRDAERRSGPGADAVVLGLVTGQAVDQPADLKHPFGSGRESGDDGRPSRSANRFDTTRCCEARSVQERHIGEIERPRTAHRVRGPHRKRRRAAAWSIRRPRR